MSDIISSSLQYVPEAARDMMVEVYASGSPFFRFGCGSADDSRVGNCRLRTEGDTSWLDIMLVVLEDR
jgi:hypothetical protein